MASVDKIIPVFDQAGIAYVLDEPMRGHTTFKIGGNSDIYVSPKSVAEIRKIVRACRENTTPLLIKGKGSDLLVSDKGVRGVVCEIGTSFSDIQLESGNRIVCESGASLKKVCEFALQHSLTGLEFAYGIPGSVGGAVYMNAGAYGGEMVDVVTRCEHLDANGDAGVFAGEQLQFGYRRSAYTDGNYVITKVYMELEKGNPSEIKEKMDDFMNRRRTKQPLEYPSAGSTFKRPEGSYASALIDQCGLKGKAVNGAIVSEKHAGFVINKGAATCKDVLCLIEKIQQEVLEKTGYMLECEVKMVGDFD